MTLAGPSKKREKFTKISKEVVGLIFPRLKSALLLFEARILSQNRCGR
jgi:hypothetical protein